MPTLTPDQIRASFLTFFEERAHRVVASSPTVPEGDPTLLFTNAGMNQFKDVLLGLEKRDYKRAASSQKCIRAGGKHNDLDEVGKDGRHLTCFEMLGNWSFGDYYKRESILWAWEYVTDVLGLDRARLYVSVYKDDDESFALWRDVAGVPVDHIVRLGDVDRGDEENFWSMGPTGPCGPCTEIYYDQHPEYGYAPWAPDFDGERFLEIWNVVFMEFNRDETGALSPLPMQSVDTGMGLDRVAAIMAEVDNVFRTDLFRAILERIHALRTGAAAPIEEIHASPDFVSYCVIADHVRTVGFAITDGAKFSNEGRGYVLRRILRRAVRHGRMLGFSQPFLFQVLDAFVDTFQHVYPELRLKQRDVRSMIRTEEERFFRTLDRGIALFEEVAQRAEEAGQKAIDGESVFKLYDTFGFPPDLTQIMAEERGLRIDEHGYQAAMQQQRERSRSADDRYAAAGEWHILQDGVADHFVGYDRLVQITDVLRFRLIPDTDRLEICLRETPFYAESGGQMGDGGQILAEDGLILEVLDTTRTTAGITHTARVAAGSLDGTALRRPVEARVDARRRYLTACNHTATHLLHAALHRHVSAQAFQAGSAVSADRLRFDFNYERPVTAEQIEAIEWWVNERIRENLPVRTHLDVPLEQAEKMGAMMIFGEKYGERVRVVEIGPDSMELCGGTHVRETNDIAWFRVVGETGVAAGVRRIEAVTNQAAFLRADADRRVLHSVSDRLRVPVGDLEDRVDRLTEETRALHKQLERLRRVQARVTADDLAASAVEVAGVRTVAAKVEVTDRDELLLIADHLRDRIGAHGVALLAAVVAEKPSLVCLVTEAAHTVRGLRAVDLVNAVAVHVEGKGGGKPTMAQAGGKNIEGLDAAVAGFGAAVAAQAGA